MGNEPAWAPRLPCLFPPAAARSLSLTVGPDVRAQGELLHVSPGSGAFSSRKSPPCMRGRGACSDGGDGGTGGAAGMGWAEPCPAPRPVFQPPACPRPLPGAGCRAAPACHGAAAAAALLTCLPPLCTAVAANPPTRGSASLGLHLLSFMKNSSCLKLCHVNARPCNASDALLHRYSQLPPPTRGSARAFKLLPPRYHPSRLRQR